MVVGLKGSPVADLAGLHLDGALWAETGLSGGMLTGVTPSSSDELDRLRQRYDRLCELMPRTAEADPDAAERVLAELQAVSEQLLALEAQGPLAAPAPAESTGSVPPGVAAGEPSLPAAPADRAAETSPPPAVDEAVPSEPPAQPASDAGSGLTAAVHPPSPSPPGPSPATRVVAFRTAGGQARTPLEPIGKPAPDAGAVPPAQPHAAGRTEPAQAETSPPQPPLPAPQPPAGGPQPGGSATLFSSAIRQWLDRHRSGTEPTAVHPEPATTEPDAAGATAAQPPVMSPAPLGPASLDLARIAASVEQQAAQIERILALCEAHQAGLEQLEARLEARLPPPPAAADPELPELRQAIEEQRQRITALAKTIHNLAQWLAGQRSNGNR